MPWARFRNAARWIVDNLLWDAAGATSRGSRGALWAMRKALFAVGASAVLTWMEWARHRPPEIALVAGIHFILVLAGIALVIAAGRWIRRLDHKTRNGLPGPRT